MSKTIKTLIVSAAVLLGSFSAASHADVQRTKGCGYEIARGVEVASGDVIRFCLHSRAGKNYITIFSGKQKSVPISVSSAGYNHNTFSKTTQNAYIGVKMPNDGGVFSFNILKNGNRTRADLKFVKNINYPQVMPLKTSGLKMNLTFENGKYTLNDFGVRKAGGGPQAKRIVLAPSM